MICLPYSTSFPKQCSTSLLRAILSAGLCAACFHTLECALLSRPTQNALSGAVSTLQQGPGMPSSPHPMPACPVSHVLSFLGPARRLNVPTMCPLFCLGFPSTSFYLFSHSQNLLDVLETENVLYVLCPQNWKEKLACSAFDISSSSSVEVSDSRSLHYDAQI